MARSIILLKPHVVYVIIVYFGLKQIDYHHSIVLAVDCECLTIVVFKEVRPNDSGANAASHSNILWMHCYLVNLVWFGLVPYMAILLVNIAIHPQMRFVTKDDFWKKLVSSSKCSEAQSANKRCCLSLSLIEAIFLTDLAFF